MIQRFADWLRRMEAAWAAASRSDFEILASDLTELREKVRQLEAKDCLPQFVRSLARTAFPS